jgi:PAS domain S-box-containing protein
LERLNIPELPFEKIPIEVLATAEIKTILEKTLKGENCKYEGWFLIPNTGERIYIRLRTSAIFSSQNSSEVIGGTGIIDDMTNWYLSKIKVQEREERFRSLFEASPTGILVVGKDGSILQVNQTMVKILGSPSEGKTKMINIHKFQPLVEGGFSSDVKECFDFGTLIDKQTQYTSKWGKNVYVHYYLAPIKDMDNKTEAVIASVLDITREKEAELKENKHQSDLQFLSQSAIDLLLLPEETDPLPFIGKKLEYFNLDASIAVLDYNEIKDNYIIKHITATNNRIEILKKLFAKNPSEIQFQGAELYKSLLFKGRITKLPKNLSEISGGTIPGPISKAIIEMMGVKGIYVLGLTHDKHIHGVVMFFSHVAEDIANSDAIETFINQSTLLLQKRFISMQMKHSENLYNSTINSTKEFIHVIDKDLKVLLLNKSIKETMEKTNHSTQVLGMSVRDAFPFLGEKTEARYLQVIKDKKVQFTEERNHLNGIEFYTNTIVTPVIENGEVVRIVTSIRDITEKKHAELQILNLKNFNEQIVNQLTEGILVEDDNGIIQFINPAITQLLDCKPEDLLYKSVFDLVPPHVRGKVEEWYKTNKTDFVKYEFDLFTLKGQRKSVIHSIIKMGKDAYFKGYLSVFTDITRRKTIEEELKVAKERAEESDRLKSSFLANMSHELRTPINGILGFSNLLQKKETDDTLRRKYIKQINASSEMLLRLIEDIIDLSKIEAGQLIIEKSQCALNELMKSLQLHFKEELVKINPDVKIEYTHCNPPELVITTDALRLRQVLSNLISNAVKFTRQGSIRFGYNLDKAGNLECIVEDTGIGISPENQNTIFDRFTQIDQSHSRKHGGTGLGLSISKLIVEALGGRIWVESELGKGSCFRFVIQAEIATLEKETKQVAKVVTTSHIWPGRTILLVEDDDLNSLFIHEMLSDTGLNIIRAKDGIEALDIVFSHPEIEIVLMDLQMPRMDGYECTRKIKEIRKSLPVIAQTAYAFSSEKKECFAAGCNDYLVKPIVPETLLVLINKYLDN